VPASALPPRRPPPGGARFFLISRNGPALQAICDDIASDGGVAAFAVADVGDAQALSAAADAAVAAFGPFDSWVHAAGVAIYAPLLETPVDEHERLFRTNYWGVVNASRVAVPALRPRGGAFVVVGSVASDIGTPVLGAYAASKHAVKGFIDSLRIELLAERAPVSVTLVRPAGSARLSPNMRRTTRVPPPRSRLPPIRPKWPHAPSSMPFSTPGVRSSWAASARFSVRARSSRLAWRTGSRASCRLCPGSPSAGERLEQS